MSSRNGKSVSSGNEPSFAPGTRLNDDVEELDPTEGAKFKLNKLVQWTTSDNKRFLPASHTCPTLIPGVYEIQHCPSSGIFFTKTEVKTEGLIRFPETASDQVVEEIQKFWNKEDIFREYKLSYKRGIMLYGPPGSGKTCTIQLITHDVIKRSGLVIKFGSPGLFMDGVRMLREIQPSTPVVVLMEDIDAIIGNHHNESEVLNILDGVERIEKVVFVATTNYPETLGPRIMNRPSRFDKRFKIGYPNEESRKIYFQHLVGKKNAVEMGIDLNRWVKDTKDFSIAHLKELFVAVIILGDKYEDAVRTLSDMKEELRSSDDDTKKMGFGYE